MLNPSILLFLVCLLVLFEKFFIEDIVKLVIDYSCYNLFMNSSSGQHSSEHVEGQGSEKPEPKTSNISISDTRNQNSKSGKYKASLIFEFKSSLMGDDF